MKYIILVLISFLVSCSKTKIEPNSIQVDTLSEWENYIQNFPRKSTTAVRDFQGNVISNASYGVLNVRVNSVQQCADAAIRLRAEYFYQKKEYDSIQFKLTNEVNIPFSKWAKGYRLNQTKTKLIQTKAETDFSRNNFEKYLQTVMTYAGTYSLHRDLKPTWPPKVGDVLVIPGFPGHAVILIKKMVVDGTNYYAFAQSWMPAQDIEIVYGHCLGYKNIRNYAPIPTPEDTLSISGYLFVPRKHLRTW